MSSKPTTLTFPQWSATASYKESDVVNGVTTGQEAYYYATQASTNQNPLSPWYLSISSWTRVDNKVRLNLASTINPPLTKGSFVQVSGAGYLGFTGCIFHGGSNYIEYFNSGPDDSGAGSGGVYSDLNPAWTTGFGWVPTYSSNVDTEMKRIVAQFGDGYSQRQRDGINSNKVMLSLVFEDRTDREKNAIKNFLEEKGGVDYFKISNIGQLQCNNAINYIGTGLKISTKSYNRNTITFNAEQVFDPV